MGAWAGEWEWGIQRWGASGGDARADRTAQQQSARRPPCPCCCKPWPLVPPGTHAVHKYDRAPVKTAGDKFSSPAGAAPAADATGLPAAAGAAAAELDGGLARLAGSLRLRGGGAAGGGSPAAAATAGADSAVAVAPLRRSCSAASSIAASCCSCDSGRSSSSSQSGCCAAAAAAGGAPPRPSPQRACSAASSIAAISRSCDSVTSSPSASQSIAGLACRSTGFANCCGSLRSDLEVSQSTHTCVWELRMQPGE